MRLKESLAAIPSSSRFCLRRPVPHVQCHLHGRRLLGLEMSVVGFLLNRRSLRNAQVPLRAVRPLPMMVGRLSLGSCQCLVCVLDRVPSLRQRRVHPWPRRDRRVAR